MVNLPATLTGLLCALETGLLFPLIVPLPYGVRKRVLRATLESRSVAKLLYGLKISLIFVTVIFADAANQAFKLTFAGRNNQPDMDAPVDPSLGATSDRAARKLLAERNLAITGATLFVGLVLWRVFELNVALVAAEEKLHHQPGDKSIQDSQHTGRSIKREEQEKRKPEPRGYSPDKANPSKLD